MLRLRMNRWLAAALCGILLIPSYALTQQPTEINSTQVDPEGQPSSAGATEEDASVVDPAFSQHVDLALARVALDTANSALLTDVALQLAEGERIVRRTHRTGVTSRALVTSAAKLCSRVGDNASLDRLIQASGSDKELLATLEAAKAISGAARSGAAIPKDGAEPETIATIERLTTLIHQAAAVGDRAALEDVRLALTEVEGLLNANQIAGLEAMIRDAEAAMPDAAAVDTALLQLMDDSRATAGKLLFAGTAEYGWSHTGVKSWGSGWETAAVSDALGKIQTNIASMVNLGQLETFTKKDISTSISGEYTYPKSVKIAFSQNKSSADATKWVNANNLLINVKNVRIKPGTAYTKTTQEPPPPFGSGARQWKAWATMLYTYEIWGPATPVSSSSIKYTLTNKTGGTVKLEFSPSGNVSSLASGKTTSCTSPVKNGVYPKVKAIASNGANWIRTIKTPNGKYEIIKTSSGIQIVP